MKVNIKYSKIKLINNFEKEIKVEEGIETLKLTHKKIPAHLCIDKNAYVKEASGNLKGILILLNMMKSCLVYQNPSMCCGCETVDGQCTVCGDTIT